ncbi:MAG TPA: NADPH:quinone oxidoreductase family protein [Methylomirabilota bacterium]|nr:NADPH:quinone oxidoreductase family protein [Methylomirabilota bacterium]
MKAVRFHQFGGPEMLKWEEVPDPEVRPRDVLIKVEAAGVNFADLMRRQGKYTTRDAFPAMLGTEAAGTVVTVGADVREFKAGDRVVCRAPRGCQAELVATPAVTVNRLPEGCSFVEAAAVPVAFLTAYHMLKTLAPLRVGETVLVHAAASGVGTAAVQLARLWGAKVFATASSDEKLALARSLGADECINYAKEDFLVEVLARTANRGVDRVLECVGGDVLIKSVKATAPGGRVMIYGRASGSLPLLDPNDFFPRNLHIMGVHIGMPPWTAEQHREALEECLGLVGAGKVKPVISATFKLSEVARAHEYLAARKTMGKVVLVP